jgi:hypothetical protein
MFPEAPAFPGAAPPAGGPPGGNAAPLAYPSAAGLPPRLRDSGTALPPGSPGAAGKRSRLPLVLGGIVIAAGVAVGGWFAISALTGGDDEGGAATGSGSGSSLGSGATAGTQTGSGAPAPTDGAIATATVDAPPPPPPDAAKPTELSIISTPPGARVFLDGSDVGVTPLKLPGTPDRHNLALLLAGHELYLAQVDGSGQFSIQLKEVTPSGDFAGIKVIKCKDKDRYYVYVDGKPSGMTCPTERIYTTLGPHTVEVYDLITETRRKWDINIKDGRLSYRIRIDP